MNGSVRLVDIAKKAGVSHVAVSKVLNNQPIRMKDETRNRILHISRKLKYRPNNIAKSLAINKTHIIGILAVTSKDISYFPEISSTIEDLASEKGYRTIICSCCGNRMKMEKSLKLLAEQRVDGIISLLFDSPKTRKILMENIGETNCVIANSLKAAENPADYVLWDIEKGTKLAMEHLFRLGHRRIAHITGKISFGYFKAKEALFKTAIRNLNLSSFKGMIARGKNETIEGGAEAMKKLINIKEIPSAVFIADDIMALGAIRAAIKAGLRIPEDISIIGFGNLRPVQEFSEIPFTSVEVGKSELGRKACSILIDRIENNTSDSPQITVKIQPELVIRRSTSNPNNRRYSL